ncbi:hypothetical protein G2W53_010825 [Senna tora]|uniref:Uncharacterized protein n=1 Tax=Senna tora TaxID=362788 RepID=A0A835CBT3_9FABA|nr:hypothetical protein G2W53_010825 [Senna tora]
MAALHGIEQRSGLTRFLDGTIHPFLQYDFGNRSYLVLQYGCTERSDQIQPSCSRNHISHCDEQHMDPNLREVSLMVLREGVSENTAEATLISADPCEVDAFRPTSFVRVASSILSSRCQTLCGIELLLQGQKNEQIHLLGEENPEAAIDSTEEKSLLSSLHLLAF